ncbi:MAG: hypothetical protein QN229_06750 [Desulfurococcaceae archaeon TW002]
MRELLNTNHEVLNILSKNYENMSIILVFPVWSSVRSGSAELKKGGSLAIVLNPDTFLQNTYWYNEWSLRRDLSNSLRRFC